MKQYTPTVAGIDVSKAQALAEMGRGGTRRTAWRAEMAAAIAARPMEPAAAGDGPMRPAVLCAAVQRLLDAADGFHFAEFETAHRYGADFIAVIGHDSRWNAENQIQLRDYGAERLNECELNPTRYDFAAAGFGCHGEHVTNPADLDSALKRANESGLPVCFIAEIEGLPAPSASGH